MWAFSALLIDFQAYLFGLLFLDIEMRPKCCTMVQIMQYGRNTQKFYELVAWRRQILKRPSIRLLLTARPPIAPNKFDAYD